MVQGLTASSAEERAETFRLLLKTQCSNGLMHESGKAEARMALWWRCRHDASWLCILMVHTECCGVFPPFAVNANDLSVCSREWFGWANSMLVALVESSLGFDCTRAAEEQHKINIVAQEKANPSELPRNGSPQDPAYFASLLATIAYDKETLTAPAYVGQHAKAM